MKASFEADKLYVELSEFCQNMHIDFGAMALRFSEQEMRRQTAREAILRLHAWLYSAKSAEMKIPADWWSHFKCDCFPKTWLKRWPPKMKVLTGRALFMDIEPDKYTKGRVLFKIDDPLSAFIKP